MNYERLRALQRRAPRPAVDFPSLAAALARFRLRPPETTASPTLLRRIGRAGVVRLPSGRWRYRFDPACEQTRMPVDCWALLPRIGSPTLVVRGEHSTILERDVAERMVKTLPTADLAELPGAHHHVTFDAPRALADVIRDWAR